MKSKLTATFNEHEIIETWEECFVTELLRRQTFDTSVTAMALVAGQIR